MSRKRRSKTATKLPEWAIDTWQRLGEPELSEIQDDYYGPLMERRSGLRRDDIVEILLDTRGLPDGLDPWIRGRLVSSHKSSLEIVDDEQKFRAIARDAIVEVRLIAHTRPPYIEDEELLTFEREDMMRRTKLHEKVEKDTAENDDSHLWG
jgi:hypothetical protein